MWSSEELSETAGRSLQNTVFFYLTQGFGFRGCHESRQMCWGDVDLRTDDNRVEFFELTGKLTKKRKVMLPRVRTKNFHN